jgi:hypothetical protein
MEIEAKAHVFALGEDRDGTWRVSSSRCPVCDRLIVSVGTEGGLVLPVWPESSMRPRLGDDVPAALEAEYRTASQIIPYSPEASAAIGRRLLHNFLATHIEIGERDLAGQLQRAVDFEEIPSYLRDALRAYSTVANLSANSDKSQRPDALTPVEPGEAEWLLDVLQSLFEHYFVQPARMRRRLNTWRRRRAHIRVTSRNATETPATPESEPELQPESEPELQPKTEPGT